MKIKKIFTFLLAGLFILGAVGCKGGQSSSSSSENGGGLPEDVTINIPTEKNIYNLKREVKTGVYEGTCTVVANKYVVAQNKAFYKIVLPSLPTANEELAASELQALLKEATGIMMPIVSETEASSADKIISLGHTKQFQQTKENITYAEYHRSGYRLFTKKDNIFICGAKESQAYLAICIRT